MTTVYTLLIFIGFAGISLTAHIYKKKRAKKVLVCPLNSDCNAVLHSDFSTLMGIPLELLGMAYYALITLSYGFLLAFPDLANPNFTFLVIGVSIFAFLFSLYLTFIQAFALRNWCVWCLTSAGLCTLILIASVVGSQFTFTELLVSHHNIITSMGIIGLAFGLGAATIYNLLFIKFLRDFRISEAEKDTLKTISQVLWLGIMVVILAGLGLILPNPESFLSNSGLMTVAVIISVLIVSESTLNLLVAPQLINISFGKKHNHHIGELHHLRKMAYAFGFISLFSWFTILFLMILPLDKLIFAQLFLAYLIVLGVAIAISQIIDFMVERQDV